MENNKEKFFAEIREQEIKYAVFQLENNSQYKILTKSKSKNNGIKHGVVTDLKIATEIVSQDLKEIEKKLNKVFDSINLIVNQREMFSTNVTSFKNLNGAKVEKRDFGYWFVVAIFE